MRLSRMIWSSLIILSPLSIIFTGCGSDDSNTTEVTNESDENTTEVITSLSSIYLNKLGDNAVVLEDDADSWKMVEIVDTNFLVQGHTLVSYASSYTYTGAVTYCDELSLAGYTDWRIPTITELTTIMNVAINSKDERDFFQHYFSDIGAGSSVYGTTFSYIWASGHSDPAQYNYYATAYWNESNGYSINNYYQGISNINKALCVRTW